MRHGPRLYAVSYFGNVCLFFSFVHQLFARSDFITLHTPLTPETKGLIGRANLDKCKKGVRIINVARGGIVDPAALVDAVNLGKVRLRCVCEHDWRVGLLLNPLKCSC